MTVLCFVGTTVFRGAEFLTELQNFFVFAEFCRFRCWSVINESLTLWLMVQLVAHLLFAWKLLKLLIHSLIHWFCIFYSYFLIDTLKNWWMCEVVNLCQTVAYAAKEDLLVNFVQSSWMILKVLNLLSNWDIAKLGKFGVVSRQIRQTDPQNLDKFDENSVVLSM